MLLGGEALQNDVAELCVAVLVTFAVAVSLPGHRFRGPASLCCSSAPSVMPSW